MFICQRKIFKEAKYFFLNCEIGNKFLPHPQSEVLSELKILSGASFLSTVNFVNEPKYMFVEITFMKQLSDACPIQSIP